MANPFLAVPLTLHLIAASGGGVPTLDVRRSCLAAAKAQITTTDRMQACIADEQNAHDQLAKAWRKFNAADRATLRQRHDGLRANLHRTPHVSRNGK
jgi:hypothetical protein